MVKKLATLWSYTKAPRTTYLLRHPLKGPRNLLALRGAKSLLKTRAAAGVGMAAATAALAVPLALRMKKRVGT